jgi:hypothetical protein
MIWKKVKDFNNYEVSDSGQIRSIDRYITCKNGAIHHAKSRLLRPTLSGNGYLIVSLWEHNKQHTRYVHRLIAEAFLDKPNGCDVVNHINGVKTDNSIRNIEWTTYHGNNLHAYRTGLKYKPTKLSLAEMEDILRSPKSAKELSQIYHCCCGTIWNIRKGNIQILKENNYGAIS